ncbi:hypothetical protein T492DRAFT_892043 [Pavlovales sp. CCMP2436]|nr:hypothetical protein T492DRAFT_892043 [Pavlovales sp. CCMP2436]
MSSFSSGFHDRIIEDINRRDATYGALPESSRALVSELCQLSQGSEGGVEQDCARVREILALGLAGVDVNVKDPAYGETLLHHAIFHSGDKVRLLISSGADPNAKCDMQGTSPAGQLLEAIEDKGMIQGEVVEDEIASLCKLKVILHALREAAAVRGIDLDDSTQQDQWEAMFKPGGPLHKGGGEEGEEGTEEEDSDES